VKRGPTRTGKSAPDSKMAAHKRQSLILMIPKRRILSEEEEKKKKSAKPGVYCQVLLLSFKDYLFWVGKNGS